MIDTEDMGGSFCINYQHIVFRVRECLIRQDDIAVLHAYMVGVLDKMGVKDIEVGGIADHVHIMGQFGILHIPDVVRACKYATTKKMKRLDPIYYADFHWQKKYGSFSVSPQHVARVRNYIAHQAHHHTKQTTNGEIQQMADCVPRPKESSGECPRTWGKCSCAVKRSCKGV